MCASKDEKIILKNTATGKEVGFTAAAVDYMLNNGWEATGEVTPGSEPDTDDEELNEEND